MRGPQVNPDAEDDEEEDAVDADGKRTVYYEKVFTETPYQISKKKSKLPYIQDPVGWLTKYFERLVRE